MIRNFGRYILTCMRNTEEILLRLRALRKEKAFRQDRLAMELGIDRTTYVRKEKGAIPITTDEWLKLASIMGKEPAYFFNSSRDFVDAVSGLSVRPDEKLLLEAYGSLSSEERGTLVSSLLLLIKALGSEKLRDVVSSAIETHIPGTEPASRP